MRNSEESRADLNNGERKFRRNLQSFDAAPKRSVVIRDLPFCCTSKDLQNFIAQHLGIPPSIAVVLRNPDGKTLQYGCALFESEDLAAKAIENVHLKRLHGRDIRVLPYSSASLREVSRSGDVLISFISLSAMVEPVTEQNIRSIVEEYGDIDYISIRQHKFKEGIQNGFGFVTMASQEENQRVLDNVKGLEVENVLYTSEESNHVKKGVRKPADDIHSEPSAVYSAESHLQEATSAPVDISPSSNSSKSPVTTNGSKKSSDMSGQQSCTNISSKSSTSQSSRSNNNTNVHNRPNAKTNARDDGKNSSLPSANQMNQSSHQPMQMSAQYVPQQHSSSTENAVVNSFQPQLMNYHQPRPYSPSTIMLSAPANPYVSTMGNNSSVNVSTVSNTSPPPTSLVTSPQLQAYPVASIPQSQQFLPSAFSSVPIYPSGNQMAQSNLHFATMHPTHSIHQLHHPQFSGNINMVPSQPLPVQNSSTSASNPNYQYPVVVDHSGNPTNTPYVVNTYMQLPGSTTQQSHLPQQSQSPHYQQSQIPHPYMHISVAPNGMNIPVASMVMTPGQASSYPLTSSTSSTSSPPYHNIQYSTPTYPHHMSGPSQNQQQHQHQHHHSQHNLSNHHHQHQQQSPQQQQQHSRQMQAAIYQQQPHQSAAFVSSTLSISQPHSQNNQSQSQSTNQQHSFTSSHSQPPPYLHSPLHEQQRR